MWIKLIKRQIKWLENKFLELKKEQKFKNGINPLDAVYMNGNVGIGVNDPTEALTILGGNKILFTGISLQNMSSSIYTNSSDNLCITAALGSGKQIEIGEHIKISHDRLRTHLFLEAQDFVTDTDYSLKGGIYENIATTGTIDISLNQYNSAYLKFTGDTTINLTNLPPVGDSRVITLRMDFQGIARPVTLPTNANSTEYGDILGDDSTKIYKVTIEVMNTADVGIIYDTIINKGK